MDMTGNFLQWNYGGEAIREPSVGRKYKKGTREIIDEKEDGKKPKSARIFQEKSISPKKDTKFIKMMKEHRENTKRRFCLNGKKKKNIVDEEQSARVSKNLREINADSNGEDLRKYYFSGKRFVGKSAILRLKNCRF